MNIHIVKQLTRMQMKDLKRLYRDAFPANEKKPFWLIRKKQWEGVTEILGLVNEENRLVGEIITIAWQNLLLVDYFAIVEDVRGQGCGKQAIRLLQERYKDKKILLEIETPEISCQNRQERARRKHFYQSCGMESMNYHVRLFGVEMEIMTYQCQVSFEEYHEIFTGVYGKRFAKNVIEIAEPNNGKDIFRNILMKDIDKHEN